MAIHVITGLGSDGRSTVISREDKMARPAQDVESIADVSAIRDVADSAEFLITTLYEAEGPPQISRPARGTLLPIATPPNGILWMEMALLGSSATELHRTDSIDFHHITGGDVELLLENGSVQLSAGDSVIVPGVPHGWRSTNGWTSNLFLIGLEPI